VRWLSHEGELPGGLGRYRLHLPIFQLSGGESLAYLRLKPDSERLVLQPVGQGLAFFPPGNFAMSWKGMTVEGGEIDFLHMDRAPLHSRLLQTEVDWTRSAAGLVSVSRQMVDLSDAATAALDWLRQEATNFVQRTLENIGQSRFGWISYRHAGIPPSTQASLEWAQLPRGKTIKGRAIDNRFEWAEVPFPLIPSLHFMFETNIEAFSWRGRKVNVLPSVPGVHEDDHYDGLSWQSRSMAPNRVMWREHYEPALAPLWEGDPRGRANTHAAGLVAEFPPAWASTICGVRFSGYIATYGEAIVWNPDHPLVGAVDEESQRWVADTFASSIDPIPFRSDLLTSRGRGAAWLMRCLSDRSWELWDGLEDREPGFLSELGELVLGHPFSTDPDGVIVGMWIEAVTRRGLDVPAAERWYFFRNRVQEQEVQRRMPRPGRDWELRRTRHRIRPKVS
jgi:hypothetical protein